MQTTDASAVAELDRLCANARRDAVERAMSGMPVGMAEIAVALWTRHLRYTPVNPASASSWKRFTHFLAVLQSTWKAAATSLTWRPLKTSRTKRNRPVGVIGAFLWGVHLVPPE